MQLESIFEMLENFKWGINIDIRIIDLLQMLILTGIIFYLGKTFYRTRAWILIKGLIGIGITYLIVSFTGMTVIKGIMEGLFSVLVVSIVIMFQPDLQKLVENVGKQSLVATVNNIIKRPQTEDNWSKDKTIYEIVSACEDMSAEKTGALIVLERGIPLEEYIDSGIPIKADISSQLLINIFEKNTPLHDGAVIIKNDKIEAATCYLPLTTNENVDKHLGTRHRAAIGISETTDSIVVVVSEETGAMSVCSDGHIQHNIDRAKLSQELHKLCKKNDEKTIKRKHNSTPLLLKIASPILAVLTCLFILNTNDPVVTKQFENVPVVILNEDVIAGKNQSYAIEDGDEVSVVLKGHRSVIESVEMTDILATADIEEMSIVNAVPIRVEMSEEYKNQIEILPNTNVLKIALENLSQVEVPIEVVVEGVNTEKLMVVEIDGNKTLTVTGTESIVKTLDKAVVVVDITGEQTDFAITKEAVVYDKNGNVVSATKLKFNNQINIKGTAFPTKIVPLNFKLGEVLPDADYYYTLNDVETEIETIQIAAEQSVLDKVEAINLIVPQDEGLETVTKMAFKLENYLPEDVYLGPSQDEEVSVSVSLTRFQKVKLSLTKDAIAIAGNDGSLKTTITDMPEFLEVIVDTSQISTDVISLTLLTPSIEVNDTIGKHTSTLTIAKIDGVSLSSNIKITYSNDMEKEEP